MSRERKRYEDAQSRQLTAAQLVCARLHGDAVIQDAELLVGGELVREVDDGDTDTKAAMAPPPLP